jgi:peroxiredoxin
MRKRICSLLRPVSSSFPAVRTVASLIVLSLMSVIAFSQMPLPKPQIESAEGKPAPDFTLKDQNGTPFRLSAQRGSRLLLIFYRGYWCPYCTGELKELAAHKADFDAVKVRLVGISVDDQQHTQQTWGNLVHRQFTLLSDPGARVIRTYGLLHAQGGLDSDDVALDTIVFVGADGIERWRRVSASLPDLPSSQEIISRIRGTTGAKPN